MVWYCIIYILTFLRVDMLTNFKLHLKIKKGTYMIMFLGELPNNYIPTRYIYR